MDYYLPAKKTVSKPTVTCLAYVALHLAAQFSAAWFEVMPGISIWYPPAGLALSLLILLGPRYSPVVLAANVAGAVLGPGLPTWWAPLLFPLLITANYAGVAWAVRRALGTQLLSGTPKGTFYFAVVMGGAPLLLSIAGTALLVPLQLTPIGLFSSSALLWWVGDVSGLLTVVPVAMAYVEPWLRDQRDEFSGRFRWNRAGIATAVAQGAALLGCLWFVFAAPTVPRQNSLYVCFLPLIWISLAHGLKGATIATLVITMGGLVGMHQSGGSNEAVAEFLLFELTVAVVGLGLGSAVSRRNLAEDRLAANEARLDRVIAGAQLGFWEWHASNHTIMYNKRCAEMVGYRIEELQPIREAWEKLIHPADVDRARQLLQDHLAGRSSLYEAEYRVRGKDQTWRWIYSRGSIVARDENQQPITVSGTHLDITARKHAEAEAQRLLKTIETSTDFVVTTDLDQSILDTNLSLLRLLGHGSAAALRGRPLRDVFPSAAIERLQAEIIPTALASGVAEGELSLRNSLGWEVPVSLVTIVHRDEASNAVTLSFVMRNISRQKEAEAENLQNERRLLQVQKAESLGVLAGGIAHDFNNLLTAMLGYANLSRLDLPPESPIHGWLRQIEIAAERAAELCRQMLAYAGRTPMSFAEVDVSELIDETKRLLNVSIGKKIQLDLQLARPIPGIRAAAAEIQQVIMNLAINASEAIGDKEGRIAIRTSSRVLDTETLGQSFDAPGLAGGPYVLIEVEDTGCGIPPESISRIFEPFFTTKFTGHGLGLPAVTGIVKAHGGAIHVVSQPGAGSCFRLLFPALATRVAAPAPPSGESPTLSGSGLVLVVDDEPGVRAIVSSLLESFGLTPLHAKDGVEGVELFRQHAAELRCVLLDLTMPRMDGEQAFAEMHQLRPDVPVLLMSGFSEKLTSERFTLVRPAAFLAKPFDRDALKSVLGRTLKSPPGTAPAEPPVPPSHSPGA